MRSITNWGFVVDYVIIVISMQKKEDSVFEPFSSSSNEGAQCCVENDC